MQNIEPMRKRKNKDAISKGKVLGRGSK